VSYFTLRIIIILMEIIKDLYISAHRPRLPSPLPIPGGPIEGGRKRLRRSPPPPIRGWRWYAPDPIKEKEKQNQRLLCLFLLSFPSLLASRCVGRYVGTV
jgi:hypothetical protein